MNVSLQFDLLGIETTFWRSEYSFQLEGIYFGSSPHSPPPRQWRWARSSWWRAPCCSSPSPSQACSESLLLESVESVRERIPAHNTNKQTNSYTRWTKQQACSPSTNHHHHHHSVKMRSGFPDPIVAMFMIQLLVQAISLLAETSDKCWSKLEGDKTE